MSPWPSATDWALNPLPGGLWATVSTKLHQTVLQAGCRYIKTRIKGLSSNFNRSLLFSVTEKGWDEWRFSLRIHFAHFRRLHNQNQVIWQFLSDLIRPPDTSASGIVLYMNPIAFHHPSAKQRCRRLTSERIYLQGLYEVKHINKSEGPIKVACATLGRQPVYKMWVVSSRTAQQQKNHVCCSAHKNDAHL